MRQRRMCLRQDARRGGDAITPAPEVLAINVGTFAMLLAARHRGAVALLSGRLDKLGDAPT